MFSIDIIFSATTYVYIGLQIEIHVWVISRYVINRLNMTEMMFNTPATYTYFRISFMNDTFHFIVTVYIGMRISFCEKS